MGHLAAPQRILGRFEFNQLSADVVQSLVVFLRAARQIRDLVVVSLAHFVCLDDVRHLSCVPLAEGFLEFGTALHVIALVQAPVQVLFN